MSEALHLRLAGVTRLALAGRGPRDAFVFEPHRLALPCWALARLEATGTEPVTLLTFDRHFDLTLPADLARVPPLSAGVRPLDEYARWELDVRNTDHVIAALEAGVVDEVIAVARSRPTGAIEGAEHRDRAGQAHRIVRAPTLDRILALDLPVGARRFILDIDLDCFTTLSDADPTTIVPWPADLIREHLLPRGSEAFWDAVLPRTLCLTLAREPYHCGGLLAEARLFATAAEVIFRDLLRTDPP